MLGEREAGESVPKFCREQLEVPGVSLAQTDLVQGNQHLVGGVMKGILLWMVGIPIPIIILLYLFGFMS